MAELAVYWNGLTVGTLVGEGANTYSFRYSHVWLRMPKVRQLSPLMMPLSSSEFRFDLDYQYGLPGMIYDSLPDAYGLRVLRRRFRELEIPESEQTPLAMLSLIGSSGLGALEYVPSLDAEDPETFKLREALVRLDRLNQEADEIQNIGAAIAGSAGKAGGRHPKAIGYRDPRSGEILITSKPLKSADDWQPVLAKFASESEAPVYEYIYMQMARAAGINVVDCYLEETAEGRHLIMERFDRAPKGEKLHLHSYAGMRNINFDLRGSTYEGYLSTVMQVTRSRQDLLQAYRRVVFNVLGHNQDDHAKNFAFLMDSKGAWHISSAYDLVFSEPDDDGGHWMSVRSHNISITREDLVALGEGFNLRKKEIAEAIEAVLEGVGRFEEFALKAKLGPGRRLVTKQRLAEIRKRFV